MSKTSLLMIDEEDEEDETAIYGMLDVLDHFLDNQRSCILRTRTIFIISPRIKSAAFDTHEEVI